MPLAVPVISSILDIGSKLIDRLIPDKLEADKMKLELLKQQQEGAFKELDADLAMALAQSKVNEIEASSTNLFKSGWRPAVGWTCVIGLLYTYLGQPLLSWYSAAHSIPVPPSLDLGDLIVLLGGMLGLGTLRTAEKFKKVS